MGHVAIHARIIFCGWSTGTENYVKFLRIMFSVDGSRFNLINVTIISY